MSTTDIINILKIPGKVNIEKVNIETRLQDTCNNGNPIMPTFHCQPFINPVKNVETSIGTQRE